MDLLLLLMSSYYPVCATMFVSTADVQSLSCLFHREQSVTVPISDVQSLSCVFNYERSVTASTADVQSLIMSVLTEFTGGVGGGGGARCRIISGEK